MKRVGGYKESCSWALFYMVSASVATISNTAHFLVLPSTYCLPLCIPDKKDVLEQLAASHKGFHSFLSVVYTRTILVHSLVV